MFLLFTAVSVSALKPEEMPEVRMENEESGQSGTGYEVYHQKLVWKQFKLKNTHTQLHVVCFSHAEVCALST